MAFYVPSAATPTEICYASGHFPFSGESRREAIWFPLSTWKFAILNGKKGNSQQCTSHERFFQYYLTMSTCFHQQPESIGNNLKPYIFHSNIVVKIRCSFPTRFILSHNSCQMNTSLQRTLYCIFELCYFMWYQEFLRYVLRKIWR